MLGDNNNESRPVKVDEVELASEEDIADSQKSERPMLSNSDPEGSAAQLKDQLEKAVLAAKICLGLLVLVFATCLIGYAVFKESTVPEGAQITYTQGTSAANQLECGEVSFNTSNGNYSLEEASCVSSDSEIGA